jgi:hypothetical protein
MEPEILYTAYWTVQFDTGPVTYKRLGVRSATFENGSVHLEFDSLCPIAAETFPTWGKVTEFKMVIEEI